MGKPMTPRPMKPYVVSGAAILKEKGQYTLLRKGVDITRTQLL